MPSIVIKGIRGVSLGMKAMGPALDTVANTSITYYAIQTKQRLEQDTPVRTGRLLRSTTIQKKGNTSQTLGQSAPYANYVNNRRHYWNAAIQIAKEWPQYHARLVGQAIGIAGRQYGGQ
jgi:hypothetical protein